MSDGDAVDGADGAEEEDGEEVGPEASHASLRAPGLHSTAGSNLWNSGDGASSSWRGTHCRGDGVGRLRREFCRLRVRQALAVAQLVGPMTMGSGWIFLGYPH